MNFDHRQFADESFTPVGAVTASAAPSVLPAAAAFGRGIGEAITMSQLARRRSRVVRIQAEIALAADDARLQLAVAYGRKAVK